MQLLPEPVRDERDDNADETALEWAAEAEYRDLRNEMLQDYAKIYLGLNREMEVIIGIAARTRSSDKPLSLDFFREGQDYVYLEKGLWTEADYQDAYELRRGYIEQGLILESHIRDETVEREFPQTSHGSF